MNIHIHTYKDMKTTGSQNLGWVGKYLSCSSNSSATGRHLPLEGATYYEQCFIDFNISDIFVVLSSLKFRNGVIWHGIFHLQ